MLTSLTLEELGQVTHDVHVLLPYRADKRGGADLPATAVYDSLGKVYKRFGQLCCVGDVHSIGIIHKQPERGQAGEGESKQHYRILAAVHANTVYAMLRKANAPDNMRRLQKGHWYEVISD